MASEKSSIGGMEAFGDSPHTIPSGALIGCSIGDFGTIAAFQFIPYLDALGWSAMSIMMLAMSMES